MKPLSTIHRIKSKYTYIYNLIIKAGFTSDYVTQLHQYNPIKYSIKVMTDGTKGKRLYSADIIGLGIEVSSYIKELQTTHEK